MTKKKPPEHKPLGRPPVHDADTIDEVLRRHSNGETITAITKLPGMPSHPWIARKAADDAAFGKRLTRARLEFADARFDLAQQIADEAAQPVMIAAFTKEGVAVLDPVTGEQVMKADITATKARAIGARLRVETIFKTIARINPAKYAERWNVNHSGSIDMGGVDDAALNTRIERKLYEIGLVDLLKAWGLAQARIEEAIGLFRVVELPTAPALPRPLPGEKEPEL